MMDNAKHIPCDLFLNPSDPIYDEEIRRFQGCPTIAVTKGEEYSSLGTRAEFVSLIWTTITLS